jgi:hypothetical protein
LNRCFLLAITADFVDLIEEKHVKTFLAFYKMKNHNEKKQFAVLFSVLENYDIMKKLKTIIADNFNINDTFCQQIKNHLLEIKNLV